MKIFVGCSSRDDIDSIYKEQAIILAEQLIKHNHDLICGGTDGVMKIFHDTFIKNKRTVTLVNVHNYFESKTTSPYIYQYDTVSERKQSISKLADVLLFLPGGFGTMDELFTVIESKRAKEHNKPIIILNINNYYVHLINQINTMYQEKFASINDKDYYFIANNIEDAIQYIKKLR